MGATVFAPVYLFAALLNDRYQYAMEVGEGGGNLYDMMVGILGNFIFTYVLFVPAVVGGTVVHGLVFLGLSANWADSCSRLFSFLLAPILPGTIILIVGIFGDLSPVYQYYVYIILATIAYGYCVSKLKIVRNWNKAQ